MRGVKKSFLQKLAFQLTRKSVEFSSDEVWKKESIPGRERSLALPGNRLIEGREMWHYAGLPEKE